MNDPAAGREQSRRHARLAALVLCLILVWLLPAAWGSPTAAQSGDPPEPRLNLDDIRALRAAAESDSSLNEAVRNTIVQMYDAAINALQAAAAHTDRAAAFRRQLAGIDRMVASLQAELSRPMPPLSTGLPEKPSTDLAELALARERARLSAHLSTLRDNERLIDERAASRSDISRSLGALDQKLDALGDELRAVGDQAADPQLKSANRTRLVAQRQAMVTEIEALRAELDLLDGKGALIPLQIDLAQRRVERSEAIVARLEETADKLRKEETQERLEWVHRECREVGEEIEQLAEIASQTARWADLLLGPEGVEAETALAEGRMIAVRKHLNDLDRMRELTVRKFEAVGYAGSAYRWWPDIPAGFPRSGDIEEKLHRLEQLIPSVQHDLIRFRQHRSRAREVREQAMLELRIQLSGEQSQALLSRARELFDIRRELLDQLIRRYDRYAQQLTELNTLGNQLLDRIREFTAFLFERVLWVRSVPRPVIPGPGTLGESIAWFVSPTRWSELLGTVGRAIWESRRTALLMAGVIVLLIVGKRPLRRRLTRLADKVGREERDSIWVTLEATLHTALLAAPLPLALFFLSYLASDAGIGHVPLSTNVGLLYFAILVGLFEMTRQISAHDGLGQKHFGWPPKSVKRLHRVLGWTEIICLPLLFITINISMTGFAISSSEQIRSYNNALGRLAFVVALLLFGSMVVSQFRPRLKGMPDPGHDLTPSHRLYMYAYPLIAASSFVPAILAIFGYYLTGYLLAYQMLLTLWLVLGLLVLGGVLGRWRRLNSRQTAGEPATEKQVRQLTRFVVTVAAAIGLIVIWSGALPMIQLMKRVQILPRIELLDTSERTEVQPTSSSGASAPAEAKDSGGKKEGDAASRSPVPGVTLPTAGAGGESLEPSSSILTLWQVLQAVIAAIVTWVLVKNLPGLVEMTLRRRTALESGVRVALMTLVRYTVMIVGISATLGFLGVSWGKVQFLAAALTFGLAFGLQEIVANFISGLIILTEQPIRVGDAVTIGNLMGRVTRIRIRATTITLWDRSEMVVPNKDFITKQLINWTLSDSKRRITVPLRIKYGADLQKVKALLFDIARQHPAVLDDPAPQVILIEFGSDAVQFDFRTFVDFGEGEKTKDELQMTIDQVFRREGIELALPQLSIQLPAGVGHAGGAAPSAPPADAPA